MNKFYFMFITFFRRYILSNNLVIIAFLTFLWLLCTGYSCIRSDCHYYYLPIIKHFTNPSLYSNDLFVTSTYNMPFLFYKLIAIASKYVDLQILLFLVLVFSNFILLTSTFYLSNFLFKNRKVAFLSSYLMMFLQYGTLAFTYPQQVVHAMTFVTPMLFLCIILYLKNNTLLSFFLAGVLFNIHPISSLLLLIIFIFDLLIIKKGPASIILLISLFIFPAIPTLKQIYDTTILSSPAVNNMDWLRIVSIRSPHHLFPLQWNINVISAFILFLILFLISFFSKKNLRYSKSIRNFFLSLIMLSALGFIFSEIFPVTVFIQLTLFRSSVYFKFLAIPFIAKFLYDKSANNFPLRIIIGTLVLLSFIYPYFALDIFLIPIFFAMLIPSKWLLKHAFFISTASVFLITISLITTSPASIINNIDIYGKLDGQRSSRTIALKIKEIIPLSATLIIPPYENGLQTDSERSTVGNWKTGGLSIWNIPYSTKWWERMDILSGGKLRYCNSYDTCLTALKIGYDSLTEAQLLNIALKYQAYYIVTHNNKLNLPILTKNSDYTVYYVENLLIKEKI